LYKSPCLKLRPHRALRTRRTLRTELSVASHIVNKRRYVFICSYSEHSVRSVRSVRSAVWQQIYTLLFSCFVRCHKTYLSKRSPLSNWNSIVECFTTGICLPSNWVFWLRSLMLKQIRHTVFWKRCSYCGLFNAVGVSQAIGLQLFLCLTKLSVLLNRSEQWNRSS
jgi:hypothetical protein